MTPSISKHTPLPIRKPFGDALGVCMLMLAMAGCDHAETVAGMEQLPRELAPFARKITDSKLPHVNVIPIIEPTSIWDSKIRGVPYYPNDRAWPSDIHGEPLVMLAQINFEEMPRLPGYPTEGILQLYISAGYVPEKQMWGMRSDNHHSTERERFTDQSFFRAIYFPKVSRDIEQLITTTPLVDFNEEYGFPAELEARLHFTSGSSYVCPEDYRFRRVFGKNSDRFFDDGVMGPNKLEEAYENFIGHAYGARIGGYAHNEQLDPRLEFPKEDWLLLFSLDSVGNGNYPVAWGDSGIGNFYIRPADLARRDFSKVMYHWSF